MASAQQAPLEDLMVAMDVVDTVRHRHILIDRELNADTRRKNLRERLRDIYVAQGIEVTDDALDAGIAALEEERFQYEPVDSGFSVWLAKLYVRRDRWGKRARVFALFGVIACGVWLFEAYLPERRLRTELPQSIELTYSSIVESSRDEAASEQARALNAAASVALASGNYSQARDLRDDLVSLAGRLQDTYNVRIVSRQNELSGVWRVPNVNETARNYYLIVEAVTPTGEIRSVPITSEEDSQTRTVSKWGVRVSAETFEQVSADKLDDGIIQDNLIARKPAGLLTPEFRIPTAGGNITNW